MAESVRRYSNRPTKNLTDLKSKLDGSLRRRAGIIDVDPGKQQSRAGKEIIMIIDTHCHAYPGNYLDMLPDASRVDCRGIGFLPFSYEEYMGHLDKYGIDIALLSNPAGNMEVGFKRDQALKQAMVCNDAYADYCRRAPHRLRWLARIPLVHLDDALGELHRCLGELGAQGVILPTNIGSEKSLDDPEYRPFWAEAARYDLPILLHPCNAPCHPRWHKYSLLQKINWPADSALALSRLVLSGIFDRHPDLKIVGAHLGGMLLMYLDRLNWQEGNPECSGTPEDHFKKLYFDVAGPVRAAAVRFVLETVGTDHVIFGGDYPHGRGGRYDQFYPLAFHAMEGLPLHQEDKEKIFSGNALRMFRIA